MPKKVQNCAMYPKMSSFRAVHNQIFQALTTYLAALIHSLLINQLQATKSSANGFPLGFNMFLNVFSFDDCDTVFTCISVKHIHEIGDTVRK